MPKRICAWLFSALIISFSLNPGFIEKSGAAEHFREGEKHRPAEKFRRKMMLNFLQMHHPDIHNQMRHLKNMEEEANALAQNFRHSRSEEEKQHIENHIRGLLEETMRQRLELTDLALHGIQEKLDEIRERHDRNKLRFDEILDHRLRKLLH